MLVYQRATSKFQGFLQMSCIRQVISELLSVTAPAPAKTKKNWDPDSTDESWRVNHMKYPQLYVESRPNYIDILCI